MVAKKHQSRLFEAFFWGLVLALPNTLFYQIENLMFLTLPISFGLAFWLSNSDLAGKERVSVLAFVGFPLLFLMSALGLLFFFFLTMGESRSLLEVSFLAGLGGMLLSFPGFAVVGAILAPNLLELPKDQMLKISIGSSIITGTGLAILTVLKVPLLSSANSSEIQFHFLSALGYGLLFGLILAWYRYQINRFGWKAKHT